MNSSSANFVPSELGNCPGELINDCLVISDDENEETEKIPIQNDQQTKLRDILWQKDEELNKLHSAHDNQDKILEELYLN